MLFRSKKADELCAKFCAEHTCDEIEEIFNRLLPRGRTAKFDWDSSQRANMSDRYTAYKTAIEAGFLTVDDVRRKEGLPALGKEEDQ